jgi:hypothetical protein
MSLSKRHLSLILILAFIAAFSVIIAQKQADSKENVVTGFNVQDVPADDGSGLMLSWKPLHRSKRIIEYRIYRGITPDQLFFIDAIPVNVKSGVASDSMYYYDNSGSEFLDIASPRNLRKEKQQTEKSPLYRKMPRDIPFLASVADSFQLVSIVERAKYYNRSRMVTMDMPDTTGMGEDAPLEPEVMAGLKSNQLSIVCMLKPGVKYYYTVMAVNERNQYQKHAPIMSGIPVPNHPDPAPALHSVVLEDTGKLNFEWELPLYKDDIAQYRIHQVSPAAVENWNANKANPAMLAGMISPVTQGGVGYGALKTYCSLPVPEGKTAAQLAAEYYTIELVDTQGLSSFSGLSQPRIRSSQDLPPSAIFRVEDKPNDKGDRLSVVWDNPIVSIVKTTSLDATFAELRVNYQLNKTETQDVKNIYFEFFRKGEDKSFTKIKEYYQDNSIVLKVPKGYDYKKGFRVKITMDVVNKSTKHKVMDKDAPYFIEQDLNYDTTMITLMPSKALYRNGVDVSEVSNVVYRKALASKNLTLVKRNTSYDNNLDVTVPYPTIFQKQVLGFRHTKGDSLITYSSNPKGQWERKARKITSGDSRTPMVLIPSTIDLTYDVENEVALETSMFAGMGPKMAAKTLKDLQERLAKVKDGLTAATDPMQQTQMQKQIESIDKQVKAYTTNAHLLKANSIKGNGSRMRYIVKAREDYTRRSTYQVVRTDGKGLFVESDLLKFDDIKDKLIGVNNTKGAKHQHLTQDKDGIAYFKPISDWFDRNKGVTLIATLLFGLMVVIFVNLAKRGKDLYIRPIAGLQEIDNAIGRATEMGRPMLYCMGNGGISDVATIASMGILGLVARRAAEYDTKLIVPCYDYIILPIAQEIVREAHYAVGRPDTFDKNSVFYLTNVQFAYVAGVNGIMIRERMATNFFMGFFAAEALLMTETGNAVGAVQIAGTDAVTQIPFFITTCDYTLIGEELYAASAYLNREPMLLGTLKAQDYFKFIILSVMIAGAVLSSFQLTGLTRLLPLK